MSNLEQSRILSRLAKTAPAMPDELAGVLFDAAQALGLVRINNPEAMKWLNPELQARVEAAAQAVSRIHGWFLTVSEDYHFPFGSPDRWTVRAKCWKAGLQITSQEVVVRGRTELEARKAIEAAIITAGC